MGLNGGGYTFIHPKDLASLTNGEVQAMFTEKSNFLMRVRRADSSQPYGVLEQLQLYQWVLLRISPLCACVLELLVKKCFIQRKPYPGAAVFATPSSDLTDPAATPKEYHKLDPTKNYHGILLILS